MKTKAIGTLREDRDGAGTIWVLGLEFVDAMSPDAGHQVPHHVEVTHAVRELEKQRDSDQIRKVGRAWTVEQWLTHWLDNIGFGLAFDVAPVRLAVVADTHADPAVPAPVLVLIDGRREVRRGREAFCSSRSGASSGRRIGTRRMVSTERCEITGQGVGWDAAEPADEDGLNVASLDERVHGGAPDAELAGSGSLGEFGWRSRAQAGVVG